MAYAETQHGKLYCEVLDQAAPWEAHGEIPVETLVDLYRCLRNSRLQIFPNARHGLPFSHASACAQALREFLAEVRESEQSTQ